MLLSLAGSILSSTATTFWNTVLASVVTLRDFDHLPGRQSLLAGVAGVDEIDELGAEDRGGPDLGLDIGRDVLDLVPVDLQFQRDRPAAAMDRGDPPDLDAAHFDSGVGLHHQT